MHLTTDLLVLKTSTQLFGKIRPSILKQLQQRTLKCSLIVLDQLKRLTRQQLQKYRWILQCCPKNIFGSYRVVRKISARNISFCFVNLLDE